jgi:hypothetical protein
MRKKKADEVPELEMDCDDPTEKNSAKVMRLIAQEYIKSGITTKDLLIEVAYYKAKYILSDRLQVAFRAKGGKKGGRKNNKDVIRNNATIDKAITKLELKGIKVTGEDLKKACDELTELEEQVPEGAIKRRLKVYRAAKKAEMTSS